VLELMVGGKLKLIGATLAGVALCAGVASAGSGGASPDPPVTPRLPGIDVSRFQGDIVWPSVARDGVRFAFIQASRGSGRDCSVVPDRCGPDEYYAVNYLGAKEAGIRVGAYHRAFVGGDGAPAVRADARREALIFTTAVGELAPGDLKPALDLETPFDNLNAAELRIWTRQWLRSVKRELGVRPIIYTNRSSWAALGDPTSFALAGHPLWVANWHVKVPQVPAQNWAGRSWRIWQHSSSGRVAGITGAVDLDWLRFGWRGLTVRR
jgi:lysozyme